MKIAFTGAHSTGKTTLHSDIKDALPSNIVLHSITEVARGVIEKGYPLNMDATVNSYIHYINDQLKEEALKIPNCHLLISDRTLLDPVAYALVNQKSTDTNIPDYFIEMMKNIWLIEKEKYDLYVFFPIEFENTLDGIRPDDEVYRKQVDQMIFSLLNKFNIKYLKISGSRDERRDLLLNTIMTNL